MIWWPPNSLVANPNVEPPEFWEPWKKVILKRMQRKHQVFAAYWIPTIEARRQAEEERKHG